MMWGTFSKCWMCHAWAVVSLTTSIVVVPMDDGESHVYGHGWLGEMVRDFRDVLTMSRGSSSYSSSVGDVE